MIQFYITFNNKQLFFKWKELYNNNEMVSVEVRRENFFREKLNWEEFMTEKAYTGIFHSKTVFFSFLCSCFI